MGHMAFLFLGFWEASIPFSVVAARLQSQVQTRLNTKGGKCGAGGLSYLASHEIKERVAGVL